MTSSLALGGLLLAVAGALEPTAARWPAATSLEELQGRLSQLVGPRNPGIGVALVDRSDIIWVGGVGVADASSGRLVTGDTLFRAASVAKMVTALAVMQLVERGHFSLDAKLSEVAPEVRFENPWEPTNPVRIAHLLEHTAGFDESHFNEHWDDHPDPRSMGELLAVNPASRRSRWPPGTRMAYSNEDYLVAGYLVEKAAGRRFDDVIRDDIFAPLQMNSASFWRTSQVRSRLAQGYQNGKPIADEEQALRPAVNLIASARDLAGFLSFWLARGQRPGTGRPLLSAAGIDRIERGETLPYAGPEQRYGLGNNIGQFEGLVGHGHLGIYEGFMASLRYFPREGFGWALLFNSNDLATRAAVEGEVLHFLTRGRPAAASAEKAGIGPPVPDGLAGLYRSAAPTLSLFAFTSDFDWLEIQEHDGRFIERSFRQHGLFQRLLHEPDREIVPSEGGGFRDPSERISSRFFFRPERGPALLVEPDGMFERMAPWPACLRRGLFFGALFALLTAPLLAFGSRSPRHRSHHPYRFRRMAAILLPNLASLSFYALYFLLSRSTQRWGRLNATTVAACLLSWSCAILSAGSWIASITVPGHAMGRWIKAHACLVSTSALGLAGYFWNAHWIGIRLWDW